MSVRVQYDEDGGTYDLGDDVDGVFIPFAQIDAATVQGRIETSRVAERELQAAGGHRPTDVTPPPAATIDAADYTDNGDGSYTRQSDGVQGHFTPTGFEPATAP